MLKNKNAIIYGAGGSIGSTVSKALAAAGAKIFLTGHHKASLSTVAEEIKAAGGTAVVSEVNARNIQEVQDHLQTVIETSGSVDISFNAIGWQAVQNAPLTEMSLDDFLRPVNISMETTFITATTAAKQMMKQGNGVILTLTATPGGIGYPQVGGFGPACCAVESFVRNMAAEVGPYGVRVVNMRSGGSIDSRVFQQAFADMGQETATAFFKKMAADTMLKRMPVMKDIADAAVFLSSEWAQNITGTTLDITCGTTAALNYKVKTSEQERFIPFD